MARLASTTMPAAIPGFGKAQKEKLLFKVKMSPNKMLQ
ncbi:hypothetical protein AAUPMB_04198, partial [Pasteurella multocida subsp. multocida str. Anand1_buffalo]